MLLSKKIISTALLLTSLAASTPSPARASEFLIGVAISAGVVTALNYISDGSNERKEVAVEAIHDDAAAYLAGAITVPTRVLQTALDESRKQIAAQDNGIDPATYSDQELARDILKLDPTTLLNSANAAALTPAMPPSAAPATTSMTGTN